MGNNKPLSLPFAVRVYPNSQVENKKSSHKDKNWRRPKSIFVFDTETRIDATQRLLFGCYRYLQQDDCVEEGLFCGDDLSGAEHEILERYITKQNNQHLRLLTRAEFLGRLFIAAYKARCLLVGFNLPFDLSRIAYDATAARGRFAGGFSLGLWSYLDEQGQELRDQYRPRIGIKHIDSKRALKGFTGRGKPDRSDLIPEDSDTGAPEDGYKFRGHFLDLRTLAFALTDRGYSLETACDAFGVEHGKSKSATHGVLTENYINYNRRDVQATAELAKKLLEEFDRHPVKLQPTKAYSPASMGKSYLRGMGISPILERQPEFPKHLLGYAQASFFGGRTSAHIRKFAVPVVYTDFLSMYPTVNCLMGLWHFVIAKEIICVEHCSQEIQSFLNGLQVDDLFIPATWKSLTAFVKIIPNGDILPNRAKYSEFSRDWQVALNYLHSDQNQDADSGLWFSLPDIVASFILTGRIPRIIDAFRIVPQGVANGLKPIKLRGQIEVNPQKQDFFKVVIEERKELSTRTDLSKEEKDRLDKALKVLANAASYGIYAEMNIQESDEKIKVTCFGLDAEPFQCSVAHPEVPGAYCFPPLASLITGAARLMLALLEHSITSMGGTYAMEDTDSMAIVATEQGGTIPCPGGPFRTKDGRAAIAAISWKQVIQIVNRFSELNPYRRDVIPGSVLKVEDVNFDPESTKQRQIYCFAISAKRYTLFLLEETGAPQLLRKGANSKTNGWKEHGLGHLLNPSDLDSEDRDWIGDLWLNIIRRSLGLPVAALPFSHLPAVGRVTVSSPTVIKPLTDFNAGKAYRDQIKPFNFLLSVQTRAFGHPTGADSKRFHLIAPYESNPRKWQIMKWIDQYSGESFGITTEGATGSRNWARVKTYDDVLTAYEYHPESKCADSDGRVCGKQTIGLLRRLHVEMVGVVYIGKESNRLEEVESGLLQDESEVYTEYADARRDEWQTKILPALKKMPLSVLVEKSGLSRRAVIDWRAARSRPHPKTQTVLENLVAKSTKSNQRN